MGSERTARWRRVVLLNAGGTLLAVGMALGSETPAWPRFLDVLVKSLVYTNCVGTLVAVGLQPALRRHAPRNLAAAFALRLAGTLAAIVAGMVAAAAVLVAVGNIEPREFVAYALPTAWPLYVYPTMLVASLGIGYYQTMSEELAETTLALRTKERDEALARQRAAEAQLAALEARVQPHFFFNALNSIAAMIPEDAEGAERMLERMSALMRSSLQHDGPPTAPLEDELRLVRDYREVERVRFRDRLRYELRIDADAGRVPVPRLSVKTLAENAVKYAVAPQRAGATIVIAASVAGDRALVSVRDDGPGFGDADPHRGHGLQLLRARLDSIFGGKASLRIDSRAGATSAVIEVPAS
jgi:sensor histidine kinase YesM